MQRSDMTEALVAELIDDVDKLGDRMIAWGERWKAYMHRIGDEATQEQLTRLEASQRRFSGRLEEFMAGLGGGEDGNG